MAVYTGRRWVNPLNKKIGRRTGKDVRAGKNIRVDEDGFENFDDYFSESDAELTRDFTRHQAIKEESESAGTQDSEDECKENQSLQHNAVSQNMPNSVVSNTTCNNFQSSQTLSQGDASNRSKFGWLRNRNIGRRTGKNITANKQIRIDENGFENFDDYFSESDMSSVSSRLSVSVVKPYPRRGSIINSHHKDDGTQSLTSQESHGTDELQSSESSQEDDGHTQSELQEQNNRTNNTGHSHHEGMYTSDDEKTFTPKTDQSSNLTHSSRSLSECDDLTYELEKEAAKTENEANNTKQISRNQTFPHSHIDTPVSSRSSRSYSKVVSEGYSSSNISYTKSQDSKLDKNDSSRQTLMNDSDDKISQGEHKMNVEVNELKLEKDIAKSDSYNNTSQRNGKTSQRNGKTSQRNGKMSVAINNSIHKSQSKTDKKHQSNVSHNNISQEMTKISVQSNESTLKRESKSSENTEDSYNSDEDRDSESEMDSDEDDAGEEHEDESDTKGEDLDESESAEDNNTENLDDQYSDNDLPEETDNVEHSDKESDEEMVEEESTAEVEKTTTELSKHIEKVQSINRGDKGINKNHKSLDENSAQIHMTNESKCMSEKGIDNEEHEDDNDDEEEEELRPSQAPSNIDVAGNKSGSITKLDIPTSVVSFNRTRKRLSYSASEASEKSIKRNKSRMEKANAELFDTDVSETSATKTTDNKTSVQTDTAENLNKVKNKKAEKEKSGEIKVAGEENNDFVCLTSRSTLAHTTELGNNENVDDDDDDIVILDYNKTKHTSRVERRLSTNNKSRKQTKKSDSESQSDSGNQIQVKPLKKGTKSEIKVKKTKGDNKVRRKTAHELNNKGDSIGQNDKTIGDDLIENLNIDDNVVTDPHSDNDMHSVNDDEVIQDIRNETQNNDDKLKKGRKEVLNETNKSAFEKNSVTKSRKTKKGKSQINSNEKTDQIDSKTSTLIETETNSDYDLVIQSCKRKSTKKKQSQVDSKNSEVKKQKYSKNAKSKRSASIDTNDVDINDTNDNDYPNIDNGDEISPAQKIQNSPKNQRKGSEIEDRNFKQENKKGSKRKTSSEDDVETKVKKTKTKKTKSDKKSRSKAKKNVSDDITVSNDRNDDMVDYSKNITPIVDTRLSMPTNFGSGVSFRVSRRSELLEDVRSGYIGKINVEMEQTGGLTPCISRPGATRKSKGRRVTICPEENIEHSLNTGTPSLNSTPLPNFDSTPVHICETTNSATPCADVESVIEDRLIMPSPSDEGLRRSRRTRLKPIEWYKNEQVVFDYRRRSGPAIIGVKPSLEIKYKKLEEKKSKSKKLKYQIRKASQQGKDKPYRKLSIHREIPPDIDLADKSDPEITIYNQNLESEDGIACIGKHEAFKAVGPSHKTPKKEDPYLITKHLSHPCMSAGSLSIKPNAEKPEQLVTADYIVFFIDHGKVLVKIHNTTTLLESGDTFMVPIGNTYSISNLRNDTAKFFYTIHKQWENSDSGDNSDACDVNISNGKSKRVSNGPDIC